MVWEKQTDMYTEKIIFASLFRLIQPVIAQFSLKAYLFDKSGKLVSAPDAAESSLPADWQALVDKPEKIYEPLIYPEQTAVRYPILVKKIYFGSLLMVDTGNRDDYKQILPVIDACIKLLAERSHELGNTVFKWLMNQNELTLLYDLVEKLSANPEQDLITNELMEQVVKKLTPSYVVIYLLDQEQNLVPNVIYPPLVNALKEYKIEKNCHFYKHMLSKRDGDYFNHDKEGLTREAVWAGLEIRKMLYVPLTTSKKVIGLVCILNKKENADFLAGDLDFVASLSGPSSVALENIILNEALKERYEDEAWKEISFRAAHKIGNIIFGLRGEINWLKTIIDEDEVGKIELHSALGRVDTAINEANSIVKEFKGYMRPYELQLTAADINQVIESALTETRNTLHTKKIKVRTHLSPHLPEVQIDIIKTKQCLKELIENSSRFLPINGKITIKSGIAIPEEYQKLDLKDKNTFISIRISDNGPGIPPDDKSKIFQPFFSTSTDSSGLGLAIVKKYMEQHGGDIFEVGTPHTGADFLLLFPV